MVGIDSVASSVQAATPVGAVLAQAIVLYVGYGGLERIVGSKLTEALTEE